VLDGLTPAFLTDYGQVSEKSKALWEEALALEKREVQLKQKILQQYGVRFYFNEIVSFGI